MQITYQKKDGTILYRLRNTILPYGVGDVTSMGWKVLNIEYEYNGKYYSMSDYNTLLHKSMQRRIRNNHLKGIFIDEIKTLFHYFIVIIILYFILIRIGV